MTDDESSLIRVQLQAAFPEIGDAEGDGVSIPEGELKDLSADRPRTALPLSKQLMILLSMGYDPESAVGQVSLLGDPLPDLSDVFLARDLEKEDAVRLNVYQRLTEKPDYRIADSFPSNLGVSGSASVNTVGSIDDRLEDTPAADHIDIELRSVARAFEDATERRTADSPRRNDRRHRPASRYATHTASEEDGLRLRPTRPSR